MKLEKIGAATPKDGDPELLPSNRDSIPHLAAKNQPKTIPALPNVESGVTLKEWRESLVRGGYFKAVEVVGGDLGPIAAIGSPLVCVGFGDSWTFVWMERKPWGWSDPKKLILAPRSRAACNYAVELAERVRKAAEAQQARIDRVKAAYLRDKFGGAA